MSFDKIEKTVYLVRHGQSEHNVSPVFQDLDSPLSDHGQKQAVHIAKRVSKLSFDALISSPVSRAKQTAEIIAKLTSKKPTYSDFFAEAVKPAFIGGKPFTDKKASSLWRQWTESLFDGNLKVEGGENYEDIISRTDRALDFLKNRPEESLVVVSHGMFIRFIVARIILGNFMTGDILRNYQKATGMENTGITVIRYQSGFEEEARWRLWIYNDHAHLG